tara:strand:- start:1080 stop:1202 length:123 start_codon:yes stop_codon:yes gene_type:complete
VLKIENGRQIIINGITKTELISEAGVKTINLNIGFSFSNF